jgi:hypothetical protein
MQIEYPAAANTADMGPHVPVFGFAIEIGQSDAFTD